ncbi:MAG: glycosyltransferase family 4 protein [Thermoplasmata archaeon]
MKLAMVNLITQTLKEPFTTSTLQDDSDLNVIQLAKRFAVRGINTTVFISDYYKPAYTIGNTFPNLQVKYLKTLLKKIFLPTRIPFTPGLLYHFWKERFDYILSYELFSFGTLLALLSPPPTRIVVWQELDKFSRFPLNIMQRIFYFFIRLFRKRIYAIVPKMNSTRRFLEENGFRDRLTPFNIYWHGHSAYLTPAPKEEARKSLGLPADKKIVLTIARFDADKGLDKLVEAAGIVSQKRTDILFLLKGDGPLKSQILQQIENNGLKDVVRVISEKMPVSKMADLISASDIFIMPSYRDLCTFSIIEAMLVGKPIIASNIEGVRDYVLDGVNGYYLGTNEPPKMAQAIIRIIEGELIGKMGIKSKEIALKLFTEEVVSEQFMSLLSSEIRSLPDSKDLEPPA